MARISGKQDHDRILARIGVAIRARRSVSNLSQEGLADAAGVDRSHMGKIERGERNVTLLVLTRICAALGAKLSEVVADAGL